MYFLWIIGKIDGLATGKRKKMEVGEAGEGGFTLLALGGLGTDLLWFGLLPWWFVEVARGLS